MISMKHLTSDMACLLDSLHVEKAIMLGHDFGGVVSWTFGQLYPDRLLAVGGINTPKYARSIGRSIDDSVPR